MADFEKALKLVLKWEGGYVNHPNDPGGHTNLGITYYTFERYASVIGVAPSISNLKQLSKENAAKIYKIGFWDKIKGDQIKDQQVANLIFDSYVNMGNMAVRIVQRQLKLLSDGKFGERTLSAVNFDDPKSLFNRIKYSRASFYAGLISNKPKLQVFERGWNNRIDSFRYV